MMNPEGDHLECLAVRTEETKIEISSSASARRFASYNSLRLSVPSQFIIHRSSFIVHWRLVGR